MPDIIESTALLLSSKAGMTDIIRFITRVAGVLAMRILQRNSAIGTCTVRLSGSVQSITILVSSTTRDAAAPMKRGQDSSAATDVYIVHLPLGARCHTDT
jgi:hypothetical protein